MSGELPDLKNDASLFEFTKADATRNTSFAVLNKLADMLPNLIGGSADLAPSNKSTMKKRGDFTAADKSGSNIHFGIREHAMAAIANGIQLHGGLRAYCATFFIFSDYMKHAMRLSALMHLPVTYILTHDSIGVGEDGPTHQPVEQLIALRSIPNMKVFRPADGKETAAAWISALTGNAPCCLVLTRQNLPQYENSGLEALKGGYILADSDKKVPDVLLIASGSEVEQCMQAKELLKGKGVDARVVSMPCMEEFEKQPQSYKDEVLPPEVKARVCVEAASPWSWYRYAGECGEIIGMSTFGASGPANKLFEMFGFTAENVVEKAFRSSIKCKNFPRSCKFARTGISVHKGCGPQKILRAARFFATTFKIPHQGQEKIKNCPLWPQFPFCGKISNLPAHTEFQNKIFTDKFLFDDERPVFQKSSFRAVFSEKFRRENEKSVLRIIRILPLSAARLPLFSVASMRNVPSSSRVSTTERYCGKRSFFPT